LTKAEIQPFLERSDSRAWWMVAVNFVLVAVAFSLPVLWLNPLSILASVLLLGGRQLGLAVIYHDCSHGVFFKTRWLNDFVGHWVCGGLLNTSLYAYRAYHLGHHRFAGTAKDPDLQLASAYPASPASLKRKFIRDVTGQTGIKAMKKQARAMRPVKNAPFFVSHSVLFSLLWVLGVSWVYVLWWVSYALTHQVVTRLRFIGEHGVALDRLSPDARDNTCTTLVSWWERVFVAPNYVNYHLEHHLNAAVPCYRLSPLHKLLRERGFFAGRDCLSCGYREVIRKAARKTAGVHEAAAPA
jgi:fatty acid desaturase